MADVITTLHPENDNTIDLYPNIKKENIPNGAIDASKIQNETITETKLAPEVQQKLVEEVVSVTVSGESGLFSETTKNKLINAKVGIIINNGFVYTKSYKNPNDSYDNYYFYNIEVHNSNVTQRTIVLHGNTGLWEYSYYNKYMGFYDDAEDKITVQKSILGDANVDYIDGDSGDFNTFTIGELKSPVILYGEDELNLESKIDDIEDLAESSFKQGLKNLMTLGQYDYYPATQMGIPMYDKIHRATGYVDFNNVSDEHFGFNLSAYDGRCTQVSVLLDDAPFTTDIQFVSNVLNRTTSWDATSYNAKASNGQLYFNIPLQTSNANALLAVRRLNIIIQYQLAEAYQHNETIIPSYPLFTLDQKGCEFLRNEYEKCRNFLTGEIGQDLYNHSGFYFECKETGVYTFSIPTVVTYINCDYSDSSANVGTVTDSNVLTVNLVAGQSYLFMINNGDWDGALDFRDTAMLSDTSYPVPYQKYNGAILHEADAGVLLWKNTSLSTFSETTLTGLPDLSKYKYIIFAYRLGGSGNATIFEKVVFDTTNKFAYLNVSSNEYTASRLIEFVSNTSIKIYGGYQGTTPNDSRCIPVAIYGSNIL